MVIEDSKSGTYSHVLCQMRFAGYEAIITVLFTSIFMIKVIYVFKSLQFQTKQINIKDIVLCLL